MYLNKINLFFLIVEMMGMWSDDSACRVAHDVRFTRLYSVLDTVVISGEDVCCVGFGTLAGVFVVCVGLS